MEEPAGDTAFPKGVNMPAGGCAKLCTSHRSFCASADLCQSKWRPNSALIFVFLRQTVIEPHVITQGLEKKK